MNKSSPRKIPRPLQSKKTVQSSLLDMKDEQLPNYFDILKGKNLKLHQDLETFAKEARLIVQCNSDNIYLDKITESNKKEFDIGFRQTTTSLIALPLPELIKEDNQTLLQTYLVSSYSSPEMKLLLPLYKWLHSLSLDTMTSLPKDKWASLDEETNEVLKSASQQYEIYQKTLTPEYNQINQSFKMFNKQQDLCLDETTREKLYAKMYRYVFLKFKAELQKIKPKRDAIVETNVHDNLITLKEDLINVITNFISNEKLIAKSNVYYIGQLHVVPIWKFITLRYIREENLKKKSVDDTNSLRYITNLRFFIVASTSINFQQRSNSLSQVMSYVDYFIKSEYSAFKPTFFQNYSSGCDDKEAFYKNEENIFTPIVKPIRQSTRTAW
jgi:hypothetical protein